MRKQQMVKAYCRSCRDTWLTTLILFFLCSYAWLELMNVGFWDLGPAVRNIYFMVKSGLVNPWGNPDKRSQPWVVLHLCQKCWGTSGLKILAGESPFSVDVQLGAPFISPVGTRAKYKSLPHPTAPHRSQTWACKTPIQCPNHTSHCAAKNHGY